MFRLSSLASFVLACTILTSSANAQSTFGSIVGVVKDPSGLVVPGATITLSGIDDSSARDATSDQDGAFQFMNVKSGRYQITVQAQGFATFKLQSVQLDARQTFRADVTLKIQSAAETIEVGSTGAQVNTENATLADSKESSTETTCPK